MENNTRELMECAAAIILKLQAPFPAQIAKSSLWAEADTVHERIQQWVKHDKIASDDVKWCEDTLARMETLSAAVAVENAAVPNADDILRLHILYLEKVKHLSNGERDTYGVYLKYLASLPTI